VNGELEIAVDEVGGIEAARREQRTDFSWNVR
jgi:hypothetical protein